MERGSPKGNSGEAGAGNLDEFWNEINAANIDTALMQKICSMPRTTSCVDHWSVNLQSPPANAVAVTLIHIRDIA